MVAIKPQDTLAQSTLAILYAADKRNDKALSKIETCLALAADDPNVLSNVGEADEIMGDRLKAIKYEAKAVRKGYALQNVASDPNMKALVADPRFKKLVK